MARRPRFAPEGYPLHITQRGNYRQPVFFSDADRLFFLALLDYHADPAQITIHGYVLMSNHLHFVLTPHAEDAASRFMQRLTGQYAQYLHGRLHRKGRLWQSRFYSCVLDPHHFLTALAYVDLNPTRAGMVENATTYPWSSAAAHCDASAAPAWLATETLHRRVPPDLWRERLRQPLARSEITALRKATHTEQPLGLPGFIQELEAKFDTKLAPNPLGRPKRREPKRDEMASQTPSPAQMSSAG
jgi:putative transposase